MGQSKDKDAWDDLADEDAKAQGISPEIARAVLATNPQLRDGGMTTDLLVKQHQKPGAAGPGKASDKPKPVTTGASFIETAKQLEKRFNEAKSKRERELMEAEARFTAEKKALLEAMTQWLVQNDPELRSPFTQQMLEQKKALFASFGFDVKVYVAARMKR